MPESRPRPLVAGNWKMNGLRASIGVLGDIAAAYGPAERARFDLLVCPPATLIVPSVAETAGSGVGIGGQDCHAEASGAHTGDVSAAMLADAGASHVIVGHSERRADHAETDAIVKAKAVAALAAGLAAIVCVGETRAEREAGRALAIVVGQLRGSLPEGAGPENLVVAYEPVWAIGTGLVPTTGDVADMHAMIRRELGSLCAGADRVRILYGGSVKPGNARELLAVPEVDGALVGGASLVAPDFLGIARAYLPE